MNVYDFDNTIYDGESGMDVFIYFLKKDPIGVVKYLPKFMEGFVKYKIGKITTDEVKNVYGYMVKEYLETVDNIEGILEDFWDVYEKKMKPFYAKKQKEDDVVISGCPEAVLGIMLKRIGVKNMIGTQLNLHTGEIGRVCYHEEKVKAFKEYYPDAKIDDFYTDSKIDLPMMALAKRVYMVDGNKIKKFDYQAYMNQNSGK